jgi:DNA-binding PadR family transcriptional regulator
LSSEISLTPTSFIVLGLLDAAGPSTPYALKQGHAISIGNFWSVPHSQLYAEPVRLAEAGYVAEEREETGRRRRTFAITEQGREALRTWAGDPATVATELRDVALLKLFFGADPAALAPGEIARHEAKLAEYERISGLLREHGGPGSEGVLLTLDAGILNAKTWIGWWSSLAGKKT